MGIELQSFMKREEMKQYLLENEYNLGKDNDDEMTIVNHAADLGYAVVLDFESQKAEFYSLNFI